MSWQIINHYILEFHVVELNAFSRSPPDFAAKNAIFRSSKSANFVENFATNPEFHQFRQISSKINIFVTTASFHHSVSLL